MGFTKLFSDIVMSTIWREDDATRIVWITMLATADAQGRVNAAIPGLADAARVSIENCENALAKLSSPDPYSRTKDYGGRRIEEIDGGWIILNYEKYRNRRGSRAEYFREYRKRQRNSSATKMQHQRNKKRSAQPQAEAEAEYINTTYLLSELLYSLIQKRKPDFKKPNIQKWAKSIDKMIRIDKRSPEKIRAVICWAQADDFWQNNILSTEKLRKQFDQLELKCEKRQPKAKLPILAGKTCSVRGCKMPAVYKFTGGEYDSYACVDHLPADVKEKYG